MKTFIRIAAAAAGLVSGVAGGIAQAQDYPAKLVRAIVGYPPGGAVDTNARLIGQKLTEVWGGTPVLIDNRGGAGSTIGTAAAAAAAPDGYTFLVASPAHAINATMYRNLPFDTETAFAAVSQLTSSPLVLVIHPSVAANSARELVALAKSKPGLLNYGSSGNGTSVHLAGALFNLMAGTDMTHVPYNGGGPATAALMANNTQVMFAGIEAMTQARAGKLRALGVTTARRSSVFPDVPTVAEGGLPGYEVDAWYGAYLPAATPRQLVEKLGRDMNRAVQNPDARERFGKLGFTVVGSSPAEFSAFTKVEIDKWRKVVNYAKVTAD